MGPQGLASHRDAILEYDVFAGIFPEDKFELVRSVCAGTKSPVALPPKSMADAQFSS